MQRVLLIQLPVPQLGRGRRTGNVPLGAACLKAASADIAGAAVDIFSPCSAGYLGDAALLAEIGRQQPQTVGFTVFAWNVDRSLWLARRLKSQGVSQILFGGPETTADNPRVHRPWVDQTVIGEGEEVFRAQLGASGGSGRRPEDFFINTPSPYQQHLLSPVVENLMVLEIQRGCPYRCAYCYYGKSRRRPVHLPDHLLQKAFAWALDHEINELVLLSPSLDTRPHLNNTLQMLARLNRSRQIAVSSETRAESIDARTADFLAAAGFNLLEIGLQTINPTALRIMKRPTDLNRFVKGVKQLQQRHIVPRIDLIMGLPGDDLSGFKASVDFLVDNGMTEDVQVFPLSVLPGTGFYRKHHALGIDYTPHPPYPVRQTRTFSRDDLIMAIDYAETRLDTAIYFLPPPDISLPPNSSEDLTAEIDGTTYITAVNLCRPKPMPALARAAGRVTAPYQLVIGPTAAEPGYLKRALPIFTRANPYTPFEIVFLEPPAPPDTKTLLDFIAIRRPHYLDVDQTNLFPDPGNRSVIFTVVNRQSSPYFSGPMQRQILWWKRNRLPSDRDLELRWGIDGILIDVPAAAEKLKRWQDRTAAMAAELTGICFADPSLQNRWLRLTAPDEYFFAVR